MEHGDLPWDDTNNTAPAKPNATTTEQAHIQTICSSFDFCEDLSIMLGDASRQGLASLLRPLGAGLAVQAGRRNSLKIRILNLY